MKNKKGQALIEFVIIIPILIMILFIIIDFGNIMYEKNKLENTSTDISILYKEKGALNEDDIYDITNDKNLNCKIIVNNDYIEIKLSKKLNIISPILKNIDNIEDIKTKRIIYNE